MGCVGGFQVTTEFNPTKLLLQLLWVELSWVELRWVLTIKEVHPTVWFPLYWKPFRKIIFIATRTAHHFWQIWEYLDTSRLCGIIKEFLQPKFITNLRLFFKYTFAIKVQCCPKMSLNIETLTVHLCVNYRGDNILDS